MASSQPSSAATGVVVALLGVVPLGWFFVRSSMESEPEIAPTTTTIAIEDLDRAPVEVEPPAPAALAESISRVLYAEGNAEAVGDQDSSELSPEVVRVLVYYDVALAVPVEDEVTP